MREKKVSGKKKTGMELSNNKGVKTFAQLAN